MGNSVERALQWVKNSPPSTVEKEYFCTTRDIFQARLDAMVRFLLDSHKIPDSDVYILSSIAGEIGNNSFDHNLGNWPDVMGIFFSYEWREDKLTIVLADRGRGLLATLKRVKPELQNDAQALRTAFMEKISGRAPESRGNGLKFVKASLAETKKHLRFISGTAEAELNELMSVKQTEKINGCLAVITN